MEDLILMLEEAVDNYNENPSDGYYVGVVQTLLICMKYNVKLWSVGKTSVNEDGVEVMTPGMMAGDDNRYYYILGMNEDDVAQYADGGGDGAASGANGTNGDETGRANSNGGNGMATTQLSLNALATQIAGNGELGGICLNPADGGCFIPREQIIRLLESFAASMF